MRSPNVVAKILEGLDGPEREEVGKLALPVLEAVMDAVDLEKAVRMKTLLMQPEGEKTLLDLREEWGGSQRELARITGLTPPTLRDLEKGRNSPVLHTVDTYLRGIGARLRQVVRAPGRNDTMLRGIWTPFNESAARPGRPSAPAAGNVAAEGLPDLYEKALARMKGADRDLVLSVLRNVADIRRRIVQAGTSIDRSVDSTQPPHPEMTLQELRQSFGLTQKDMGRRLGVSATAVGHFETGLHASPRLDKLGRYVRALDPGARLQLIAEFFDKRPPVLISGVAGAKRPGHRFKPRP